MHTIPPVEIALLREHARLPAREVVLALFADHYRASLERVAHADAHDDLPASLLSAEPVADFAALALGEDGFGPAAPVRAVGGGSPSLYGAGADDGFDLGPDAFGFIADDGPEGEGDAADDVFAFADALASEPAARPVSPLAMAAAEVGEEEDAWSALADEDDEPVVAAADEDEDLGPLADALLAQASAPEEELTAGAVEPEPAELDELEDDEAAALAALDTAELEALEAEAPAARDEATTMMAAFVDDVHAQGAAGGGDEATTMIAALADDDDAGEDGAGEGGAGAPDLSTLSEGERHTRRGRRATRKVKRNGK